jgi:hypothetical protein
MLAENIFTQTVLNSWKAVSRRIDDLAVKFPAEHFDARVAPDGNRVVYLFGHLAVAHDRMFTLLRIGKRLHPELDDAYFDNPDRTFPDPMSPADLTAALNEIHIALNRAFDALAPADWLQRHSEVAEAEFTENPTRNRLAILLSRTNHASLHTGQIVSTKLTLQRHVGQ